MIGSDIEQIVDQIDPDFPDDYKGDIRLVLNICETIEVMQLVNDQLNIDNESFNIIPINKLRRLHGEVC